ncbi:MAG: hypothetical protein A2161_21555 [Candidatus Schekmanbacteria bacterium RBG_13_48_7]|uniref:NodB homology domain-containing protein n=1 Tax=Candidatus Schekmanbacteria bacterium RBG_13_48_7 TaxID=1817878 RepID=A0A1F7RPU7_9BACT|nr:MAG: hypothetical protein A2161_21555 [Candidatus Schekmanbacteria bacterium RBG_13_48_7]
MSNHVLEGKNAAITIDLHEEDDPYDIAYCHEWLQNAGVPATFFIPTMLLKQTRFKQVIASLNNWEHELGTHSHCHDADEIEALKSNDIKKLKFLTVSKYCFEDFFGFSPKSFRSPAWCQLGSSALNELAWLDYAVDSSSTPQRMGIFSSYPRENPFIFTRRIPYLINETILEIPTSTFIFPFASPSFQTFRFWGSMIFLVFFLVESKLNSNVVINVQFHPGDFSPNGLDYPKPRIKLQDFLPKTPGGIKAKFWIRERNRKKISRITHSLINNLTSARFNTLYQLYNKIVDKIPGEYITQPVY